MRRFLALALFSVLLSGMHATAFAQARLFNQAELDALLAPVALYPDALLSQVLVAATYPDAVREAAAWSRATPHLKGDEAVRAAETMPWDPSVKALLAFPDLLARMDESPQWTADLGAAFLSQEPHVMDTIQSLRHRAQASGALQNNEHQQVLQQGETLIVQSVHPQIVYVPYYDPYVVYGSWWWPAYRPVLWRPWYHRDSVAVSTGFFVGSVDWQRRHVVRPQIQPHHPHARPVPHRERERRVEERRRPVTVHNHVQQTQSPRPIVQGAQIRPFVEGREQRAAPPRGPRAEPRQHRTEPRQTQPRESRREHRAEPRGNPRGNISEGRQSRPGRSG